MSKQTEPKIPLTPLEASIMRIVRGAIKDVDTQKPERIEIRIHIDHEERKVEVDVDYTDEPDVSRNKLIHVVDVPKLLLPPKL